jgi:alkyl hydroperoxide reductase subunit AhpC
MLRYILQLKVAVLEYNTGIYFPYYFSKYHILMFNAFDFAAGACTTHITGISNLKLRLSFLNTAVL